MGDIPEPIAPHPSRSHLPLSVRLVAALTLGSGIVSLLSIAVPALPARRPWLDDVFPFEISHVSRMLALLSGFALILTSVNLWRRKRRAWQVATALSIAGIVLHLLKGHDHFVSLVSVALLAVLMRTHGHFTVRSGPPLFRGAMLRIAIAMLSALAYALAGFWFLDPRAFGANFHLAEALRRSLLFLSLSGDPSLSPHTHHAAWFLRSLELVSAGTAVYILVAIFRPAAYVFRAVPRERALAAAILERHGSSALDYFKVWPDKSYLFTADEECFVAYRVGAGFAVALGDPVGPADAIEGAIAVFATFCAENDWRVGFHQVPPDHLEAYARLGFRKLKIGDDAIADLAAFTLEGRAGKEFRHTLSRLEKGGMHVERFEPPVPEAVMKSLRTVSDEWLAIPGRRERRFTLGWFDEDYLTSTPILAAVDGAGGIVAFLNFIPSHVPGEATCDLMRRRTHAPNGVMDYLFIRALLDAKERGFRRFNFGMAPMSGFDEREEAGPEERAVHLFFQHLNFLFSYRGLRAYKAKFAHHWEPRYSIYRNVLDLPHLAVAIGVISEMKR